MVYFIVNNDWVKHERSIKQELNYFVIAYILKGIRAFFAILTGTSTVAIFLFSVMSFIVIGIGNSSHPSGMGPDVGFWDRALILFPLCGGGALTLFMGFITTLLWPWKSSEGDTTHLGGDNSSTDPLCDQSFGYTNNINHDKTPYWVDDNCDGDTDEDINT